VTSRRLSSWTTDLVKFVYPLLWFGGIGWVVLRLSRQPLTGEHVRFVGIWLGGTVFLLWLGRRYRRVDGRPDGLVVGDGRAEVFVPWREIERVTQNRWVKLRPVTLHLRGGTELGDRIAFIPAGARRLAFWNEDDVVRELRERAGLARPVSDSS
jgi:hypothetical protein